MGRFVRNCRLGSVVRNCRFPFIVFFPRAIFYNIPVRIPRALGIQIPISLIARDRRYPYCMHTDSRKGILEISIGIPNTEQQAPQQFLGIPKRQRSRQ